MVRAANYPPGMAPTATPAPLVIVALNPSLVGVGEHGAMVCLKPVNESQLEQITLMANISQGGYVLDNNIPAENIGSNRTCFEVVDAKYTAGQPVSVELNATASGKTVQNGTQVVDVGNYMLFPWYSYLYGTSEFNPNIGTPSSNHVDAWDIRPVTSVLYPDAYGHPVYAPCDAIVYKAEITPITGAHNMWLYCSDVGFLVQLGHMDNKVSVGNQVTTGTLLGNLMWDPGISSPHNHFTVRLPNKIPPSQSLSIMDNSTYVNPMHPEKQLGGTPLPYGFWLENIPQSMKNMFFNGGP